MGFFQDLRSSIALTTAERAELEKLRRIVSRCPLCHQELYANHPQQPKATARPQPAPYMDTWGPDSETVRWVGDYKP